MHKKIGIVGQMILAAIPIVVTQLYAAYRVKRFKRGVLVILLVIAIDTTFIYFIYDVNWEEELTSEGMRLLQLTYNFALTLMVNILLPLYFVRKWTIEYNEKIISSSG